jgi:hypothetical protein
MIDAERRSTWTDAFALGAGRSGVDWVAAVAPMVPVSAPRAPVVAFTLLGQRLAHLDHRRSHDGLAPLVAVVDPTPPIPDDWRVWVQRALLGRDGAPIATRLVPRLRQGGFRLHPFDVPGLAASLVGVDDLGPVERAALGRVVVELDPTSWRTWPKEARAAHLVAWRRRDADEARTTWEASFSEEPAPLRAELVAALHEGLGPADLPLLERAAHDRSQTVQAAARGLLARVPGTEAYAAAVVALAGRFRREGAGAWTLGEGVNLIGVVAAVGAVRWPDLAVALDVAVGSDPRADRAARLAFARSAALAGDAATTLRALSDVDDLGADEVLVIVEGAPALTPYDALAALAPRLSTRPVPVLSALGWASRVRPHLPDGVAARLLSGGLDVDRSALHPLDADLAALFATFPTSVARSARAWLGETPPSRTGAVLELLSRLDSLGAPR